jgi:hypothetical protein
MNKSVKESADVEKLEKDNWNGTAIAYYSIMISTRMSQACLNIASGNKMKLSLYRSYYYSI